MKKILIVPAILGASAMLAACTGPLPVTYVPATAGPTVPLTIQMDNGDGTKASFFGEAYAYTDDKCSVVYPRKDRLGVHPYMKSGEQFPVAPVPVDMPFTFSLSTWDTTGIWTWGCSVTATFTPQADRQYFARYTSQGEPGQCHIALTDQDHRPVSFIEPETSCAHTTVGLVRSGKRWVQKTTIQVRSR